MSGPSSGFSTGPSTGPSVGLAPDLLARLAGHLREEQGPGPGVFQSIDQQGIKLAAASLGLTLNQAMRLCLEQEIWPLRFCRNRGLFTASEQATLLASQAAIIGCGGLGGIDLTLLARLGLGSLTLCDPDTFCESNLNRQLLCREDRLGMNKALAAQEELAQIASHVQTRVFPIAATADNLPEILQGVDIVLDGLDNLTSRQDLAQAAQQAGIPYVYGSLAGLEGFACLVRPEQAAEAGPGQMFYDSGHSKRAEQLLGVPTLTPLGVGILQCLLAIRALLGWQTLDQVDQGLWHLDLTLPEIECLLW